MQYTLLGSIGRRPGSGSSSKVTGEILEIVEAQMRHDDETIASQLHAILNPLTANDALPNYPSTAKAVNAVT